MATPIITNLDNVNKTYTADGVNYALDPSTNRFAVASTIKPVSNAALQAAVPVSVPPAPTIDRNFAAINSTTNTTQVDSLEQERKAALTERVSLYDQLSGRTADTIQAENQAGMPELDKTVSDLQKVSDQKAREYNLVGQTTPYSLAGQGRGITTGLLRGQEAQIQRQKQTSLAVDKLIADSSVAAAQSNLAYAKNLVERAMALKYDPILAKIEAQDRFLKENELSLSRADKKLADEKAAANEKEKTRIENERADKTAFYSLLNTAGATGNATPGQLEFLAKNAKTVDDFFALGGGDLLAKDTMKFIEMPDGTTKMVNAKTGEELKTYGNSYNDDGGTGENQNALTYARQFAVDGKMPSLADLQKLGTTPAEITRMAKELPKQTGQLVSTQTGVKDVSIPAASQDDFVRLYNITENIKKLKELDKKRVGGLVSGTLGKVFGSDDQAAYLTARKAIVDDLSRMQSGAALTLDEVAFYQDYLPGRFSEFLLLGQDSMKKIENFETQMNNKLKDKLNSNGLSIYGYSTVKLGDKEYKVGDEIEINGVKGRVLPDGQISTIKGQTPTPSSPVSVTIPASSRLSFVNNNPGNLRFAGQTGAVQGEGGFAKFPSPQAGVKALENQIKLDISRGLTLADFIKKFAPPTENNTSHYIKVIANATSSSPSTKLSQIDINKLLRAIANHESGTKIV